jgi:hypothetical protein
MSLIKDTTYEGKWEAFSELQAAWAIISKSLYTNLKFVISLKQTFRNSIKIHFKILNVFFQ